MTSAFFEKYCAQQIQDRDVVGTSPGSVPENELFICMCDVDPGAAPDYCEFPTNERQAGQAASS